MTDIIASAPMALTRLCASERAREKPLARPRLEVLFKAIGEAFQLAYVAPYATARRPLALPEAELEGRDPNW